MDFDLSENFTFPDPNITEKVFGNEGNENANHLFLTVFTMTCFFSTSASVILIYIILKFPKLQKDQTNLLILNFFLVNCLFLVLTPVSFLVSEHINQSEAVMRFYCILDEMLMTFFLCNLTQVMQLSLFWYWSIYHQNVHRFVSRHLKMYIALCYIFTAFCFGIFIDSCSSMGMIYISPLFAFSSYVILLILQITLNILHLCKRKHITVAYSNVTMIITNVFVYSWVPGFAFFFLTMFMEQGWRDLGVYGLVFYIISFLHPVISLVVLYKYNEIYGVFIREVFCKCYSNNYKNETLDEHPEDNSSESRNNVIVH